MGLTMPLAPDAWVIVHHYPDGSGLLGALGPFVTEDDAGYALDQLRQSHDITGHDSWTVLPMRTVSDDPGIVDFRSAEETA